MSKEGKFFVRSRDPEAESRLEYFDSPQCSSLYGSTAKVDRTGTIFIPRWVYVGPGPIDWDVYAPLTRTRWSEETLRRKGLQSKQFWRLEIAQVQEDEGSVETGIRMVGDILAGLKQREQAQVAAVLSRIRYLREYFQERELSTIPREEREVLQQETIAIFSEVGLDPESVKLPLKLLMFQWTTKGSLGEDSLGRINAMITDQSFDAAESRAVQREEAVGGYAVVKYAQNEVALTFARSFDRSILLRVGDEVANRLLRNVYLEDPRRRVGRDYGYTIGKVRTLARFLDQTKVRPYRPVAQEMGEDLGILQGLLEEGRRTEIHEVGLVDRLRGDVVRFRETLITHAQDYPGNST